MNIFRKKPKPKDNGMDAASCHEKIKKSHSDYRDYLKLVQEQSRKAIKDNGTWLKPDKQSEG